jgi:AcrR family transcriptional regulator
MSTTPAVTAREPKRQRGRIRVAAIMQAGIDVFTEKGYDAATMTEIAARSGTAIGSLYRFFPTKESLADALLGQYTQHALDGLAELRARASEMTLDEIADALVDFRLALAPERSFAIVLLDARGGSGDLREQFRNAMLRGLAGILRDAIPSLPRAKSAATATVLLHILKAVTAADQEKPALRRALLAEIKGLVRAYLALARRGAGARRFGLTTQRLMTARSHTLNQKILK